MVTRKWDESKHPRKPAGTPDGGEFTSTEMASFEHLVYWNKQIAKHERTAATLAEKARLTGETRWQKQAAKNLETANSIKRTNHYAMAKWEVEQARGAGRVPKGTKGSW